MSIDLHESGLPWALDCRIDCWERRELEKQLDWDYSVCLECQPMLRNVNQWMNIHLRPRRRRRHSTHPTQTDKQHLHWRPMKPRRERSVCFTRWWSIRSLTLPRYCSNDTSLPWTSLTVNEYKSSAKQGAKARITTNRTNIWKKRGEMQTSSGIGECF